MSRRPRPPLEPGDHRHGRATSYNNHGCRCDDCTDAWSQACKGRSWRAGRSRPWADYNAARGGRTHGLRATYVSGCRCRACADAERDYRAAYRARRLVAAGR